MKKITTLLFAIILLCGTVQAQDPYKHSVGVMGGFYPNLAGYTGIGISYKGFLAPHFGFQTEFIYAGWNNDFLQLTIAASGMYQNNITAGLSWFAGGGLSFGTGYYTYIIEGRKTASLGAVYALGGLEYTFDFPMSIQLDARPGLGLHQKKCIFLFSAVISIRYVIK